MTQFIQKLPVQKISNTTWRSSRDGMDAVAAYYRAVTKSCDVACSFLYILLEDAVATCIAGIDPWRSI